MTDEPRDGEPLDALRRAFEALPAPAPVRKLGAEDADTRRVVAWMAAAFSAQTPAAGAPPAALLARRAPPPERVAWRPLAAAAVLLVLLGGGLLLADRALRPRATSPLPPLAQVQPAEPPRELPPAPEPAPQAPGIVAAADDHLELRSGRVRVLLFLKTPPSPREELR